MQECTKSLLARVHPVPRDVTVPYSLVAQLWVGCWDVDTWNIGYKKEEGHGADKLIVVHLSRQTILHLYRTHVIISVFREIHF